MDKETISSGIFRKESDILSSGLYDATDIVAAAIYDGSGTTPGFNAVSFLRGTIDEIAVGPFTMSTGSSADIKAGAYITISGITVTNLGLDISWLNGIWVVKLVSGSAMTLCAGNSFDENNVTPSVTAHILSIGAIGSFTVSSAPSQLVVESELDGLVPERWNSTAKSWEEATQVWQYDFKNYLTKEI